MKEIYTLFSMEMKKILSLIDNNDYANASTEFLEIDDNPINEKAKKTKEAKSGKCRKGLISETGGCGNCLKQTHTTTLDTKPQPNILYIIKARTALKSEYG